MKGALRPVLRWLQWTLFTTAAVILGYCGVVLADTWNFERVESRQLDTIVAQRPPATVASASASQAPRSPSADGLIGRMEIPRLAISVMVMEGTTSKILRRAAGHIPGTALPGEIGNIGISAHRDTFFRPLRNVRQDDIINIVTAEGNYQYRVTSMKIVKPEDISVLAASTTGVLTLVTCYPFYYVGAAPERFIVRADLVKPAE